MAPKLEVRPVGPESFDDVYPLLLLFGNSNMSRDDWRQMLFTYTWWDGPVRGYAMYADGVPVGFMGTIFSNRRIMGRDEVFCNTSSWIVREEHRNASIMLLKPVLALHECTIVNLTPSERGYAIFKKFGFKPLESEQLMMFPLASPSRIFGGSFTSDSNELLRDLPNEERTIFQELSTSPRVRHVLLRRRGRNCYLVATPVRVKRLPFAELQYIGDPKFFWENRGLAHIALLRTMGAVGVAVDGRFTTGRTVRWALRYSAKRLYRPAHPDTPPDAIDGLFSEFMTLKAAG
ncbi:MAG: hypothetical protein GIW99_04915 [Candidatus Eremiobacteraeota bacterium]|nr:hypothetical protein [Candidatus Eremiobacteraeota bacterium]